MSETKLPDIVERLRDVSACDPACQGRCVQCPDDIVRDARDEIVCLRAKITRLRAHAGWHEAIEAARIVHDTFKRDIEQGYVTKDKQFAIDILGKVLLPPGGEKAKEQT